MLRSVNLQPTVERMLDEIAEGQGLKQSEVIQDAVKLMKFITDELSRGRELYTVDVDGQNPRQLVLM